MIKSENDEKYIAVQIADITNQKNLEAKLIKNEILAQRNLEELEWIYLNAPIGLCYLDLDLQIGRAHV